jgi:hypothetical protein
MSGFTRQGLPNTRPAPVKAPLIAFIAEEEIAIVAASLDPFLIDGPCPHNGGASHQPVGSCGEVVCRHCAAIFWR